MTLRDFFDEKLLMISLKSSSRSKYILYNIYKAVIKYFIIRLINISSFHKYDFAYYLVLLKNYIMSYGGGGFHPLNPALI